MRYSMLLPVAAGAFLVLIGCGGREGAPRVTTPVARLVHEDRLSGSIRVTDDLLASLEVAGSVAELNDTGPAGTDHWEIDVDRLRTIGFGVLDVPHVQLRLLSPAGTVVAQARSGDPATIVRLAPGRYRVELVNRGSAHLFVRVGWQTGEASRADFREGFYAVTAYSASVQRVVSLRPLLGAIYKPTPSDFAQKGTGQGSPYEDSDFCCEDFRDSWGPTGRNDIAQLKAAGVNFLHFYDWNDPNFTSGPNNFDRRHRNFLQYCANNGMTYAVPISNYAISNNRSDIVGNIVRELYNGSQRWSGLVMWQIGNEYDANNFDPAVIARTAKQIADVEDQLGILESERPAMTSPVTFGLNGGSIEGVVKTQALENAFDAAGLTKLWTGRWIASANSFNPGSDLARWIPQFQQAIGIPFCLFEVGKEIGGVLNGVYSPDYGDVHDEQQQGAFYAAQLAAVLPFAKDSTSLYLGQCVFSFVNEAYKGGTEATFGVYSLGAPSGRQGTFAKNGWTYPLDNYVEKPSFTAMKNAYGAAKNGQ